MKMANLGIASAGLNKLLMAKDQKYSREQTILCCGFTIIVNILKTRKVSNIQHQVCLVVHIQKQNLQSY